MHWKEFSGCVPERSNFQTNLLHKAELRSNLYLNSNISSFKLDILRKDYHWAKAGPATSRAAMAARLTTDSIQSTTIIPLTVRVSLMLKTARHMLLARPFSRALYSANILFFMQTISTLEVPDRFSTRVGRHQRPEGLSESPADTGSSLRQPYTFHWNNCSQNTGCLLRNVCHSQRFAGKSESSRSSTIILRVV